MSDNFEFLLGFLLLNCTCGDKTVSLGAYVQVARGYGRYRVLVILQDWFLNWGILYAVHELFFGILRIAKLLLLIFRRVLETV